MSVCDAVFDQQDAEVVCKELDCGTPVQVLGAADFDKGDPWPNAFNRQRYDTNNPFA